MAIDDLRALITVLAFIAFIGIVIWAYSRKRRRDFEEAARLPFRGEEFDSENQEKHSRKGQPR